MSQHTIMKFAHPVFHGAFGQEVIVTDEPKDELITRVRDALLDLETLGNESDDERDRRLLRKLGPAGVRGIIVKDLTNGDTYLSPLALANLLAIYTSATVTMELALPGVRPNGA